MTTQQIIACIMSVFCILFLFMLPYNGDGGESGKD